MKILVIDDTKENLSSVKQTLKGHEVTVCDSYEDALLLICPDQGPRPRVMSPYWDAVLCDLQMPLPAKTTYGDSLRPEENEGSLSSIGWSLALLAAKNGAKYVAVATTMGHGRVSYIVNPLSGHIFKIDDTNVLITNFVSRVGVKGTEGGKCSDCKGTGKKGPYRCGRCKDGIGFAEIGKDWGNVLDKVMGKDELKEFAPYDRCCYK